MKLLDLYKRMLPLIGLETVKGGGIVMESTGEPVIVGSKELVLPLTAHLRGDTDKQIFHPMTEDMTMGVSLVLQTYVSHANSWLNFMIAEVIKESCIKAIEPVSASEVNSVVTLGKLPELSKPDVVSINKVITAANDEQELVDILIKNGGKTVAIVYPLLEKIDEINKNNQPLVLYGVKHTKKAWAVLPILLRVICPLQMYSSNAKGAPITHAILVVITSLYNDIEEWLTLIGAKTTIHRNHLMLKYMHIFNKKEVYKVINEVPAQPGNRGSVKSLPETTVNTALAAPEPTVQVAPAPVAGTVTVAPVAAAPVAPTVVAAPGVAPTVVAAPGVAPTVVAAPVAPVGVAAPVALAPVAAAPVHVAPPVILGNAPTRAWGANIPPPQPHPWNGVAAPVAAPAPTAATRWATAPAAPVVSAAPLLAPVGVAPAAQIPAAPTAPVVAAVGQNPPWVV